MLTPAVQLGDWLIVVLGHAGGELPVRRAWHQTEETFGDQLTDADREPLLSTRQQRWQNRMAWERHRLVQQGVLHKVEDAGRGQWSLTEKGWELFERLVPAVRRQAHLETPPLPPLPGQFSRVSAAVREVLERGSPSSAEIEAAAAAGRIADPAAFERNHARLRERMVALETEFSLNGMGFSRQALRKAGEAAAALEEMHLAARPERAAARPSR